MLRVRPGPIAAHLQGNAPLERRADWPRRRRPCRRCPARGRSRSPGCRDSPSAARRWRNSRRPGGRLDVRCSRVARTSARWRSRANGRRPGPRSPRRTEGTDRHTPETGCLAQRLAEHELAVDQVQRQIGSFAEARGIARSTIPPARASRPAIGSAGRPGGPRPARPGSRVPLPSRNASTSGQAPSRQSRRSRGPAREQPWWSNGADR